MRVLTYFWNIMLRLKLWYQLPLYLLLFAASTITMVLAASYLYLVPSLPEADNLKDVTLQTPLRIYAQDGTTLIGEFGEQHRIPIDYDAIPLIYIQAITAAEDDRFFEHNGIEIKSLTRAAYELLKYRSIRSGGSTITMQVARNFFLSRDQTFLRKFNEIILSLQIEKLLTKEEIMTLYVNKIFLGQRAYGIAAAAHVYYGKQLDELTIAETAMLAGLPKAPSSYNPISNPERALTRRNWVLSRMHKLGHINDEEYEEALNSKVNARFHHSVIARDSGYMAEAARSFAVNKFGEEAYTNGFKIITTLDIDLQRAAVASLRDQLHDYDERHGWRGGNSELDTSALPDYRLLPTYDELLSGQAASKISNADSPQTEARAAWQKALSKLNPVGELEPVVVTSLEGQTATVVFNHGTRTTLSWNNMSWARPYVHVNQRGAAPQQASDIFSVNDVIYVRPIKQNSTSVDWRLAQIPAVAGGIVATDPQTGAIKAMQGGYSFSHSKYNRVMQANRQTGSAFKPFIYSIAMLHGVTPGTIINDAPIVLQDGSASAWRPMGASRRFYGPTPVREALYRSLNLVSVRLLLQTGIDNTLKNLSAFGLKPENYPRELAISLGSASNTPLDMAAAYGVFANGGFYLEPWFIQRVESADDASLLWQAPTPLFCEDDADCEQVKYNFVQQSGLEHLGEDPATVPRVITAKRTLEARNAWLMDSMLKDVIRKGTARQAASLNRNDIAGKTGTTNDFFDAWFVGYTPALSTAVWIGFDQPQTLGRREYAGSVALPAWTSFMAQALRNTPETILPMPENITVARINRKTGYRTKSTGGGTIDEYFPTELLPGFEYTDPFSSSDDTRFSGEQTQVEDLF